MADTNDNKSSINEAILDYVKKCVEYAGNLLQGADGKLYFIDAVEFCYDNNYLQLVVVSEGNKHTVFANGDTFYVKELVTKSCNDSRFNTLATA